jgi:Tat protein translocase TatB subunit
VEIFGMGFGEILLIALVALIILGPDRLPEAARTVGKGISEFRRAVEPARSVWRDLSSELNNVANTTTSVLSTAPTPRRNTPEKIHPVLEMMTDEEKAEFEAGGDMPPHIAEQLVAEASAYHASGNGAREAVELPHIDYAMPHAEIRYEPEPAATEELYYPSPNEEDEPTPRTDP